jgi:hypothetical protein
VINFSKKEITAVAAVGWDNVISIINVATCYGLDGLGIESWWGRDFLHQSRPALQPNQSPVQWGPGLFPGCKAAGVWC